MRYYKYRLVSFVQTIVGFSLGEKCKTYDRMAENKKGRTKRDLKQGDLSNLHLFMNRNECRQTCVIHRELVSQNSVSLCRNYLRLRGERKEDPLGSNAGQPHNEESCFMKRLHFLPSFLPPTLRPSFLSPPTFLHFVHGPCVWTTPDKAWEGGDGECSLLWSRCFHPRTIAESLPHRMQPWEFPWGAGSQTPRPVFSHHFLPATFPPVLWGTGRWFLGFVSLCATYEWTCIALLFLPFT